MLYIVARKLNLLEGAQISLFFSDTTFQGEMEENLLDARSGKNNSHYYSDPKLSGRQHKLFGACSVGPDSRPKFNDFVRLTSGRELPIPEIPLAFPLPARGKLFPLNPDPTEVLLLFIYNGPTDLCESLTDNA